MSLKIRIAATTFLLEALLIAALLWVTLSYAVHSVSAQIAASEQTTLQLIADLSRSALLTEDYAELESFIAETVKDPRIEGVILADRRGRVVVATENRLVGKPMPALAEDEHHHWRTRIVRGHSNPLGALFVRYSDAALAMLYEQIRALALIVAACGLILTSIASIGLGYVLTRRLQRLADAADRVIEDGAPIIAETAGNDEVARLGRAFAGVVDRLQHNLSELKRTRDLLIEPTEAMSQGFAVWDKDDRLVLFNRRFATLFTGIGAQIAHGLGFQTFGEALFPHLAFAPLRAPTAEAWIAQRAADRTRPHSLTELSLIDGRCIEVRQTRTQDGRNVCLFTDVTADKRHEQALLESEQRLRAIMDSVFDAILTVDAAGIIDTVNLAVEGLFEVRAGDVVGQPLGALFAVNADAAGRDAIKAAGLADLSLEPRGYLREMWGLRGCERPFPVEISVSRAWLAGRRLFIVTARDISQRKAAEQEIVYHATHDHLTGLPNRNHFLQRLHAALAGAGRTERPLAVMFLDLDRFKIINDSLGHLIGDALLVAVAKRLRRCLRQHDMVARMGGDEFTVLLPDIEDVQAARAIGAKIIATMQRPFLVKGHELHVTTSLGISVYPQHGSSAEVLLRHADAALYQAKAHGKNRWCLFATLMAGEEHHTSVHMETQLRLAIERRQLHVVYQPQIDLRSGRIVGVEALLRWRSPSLGMVPPDVFVPIAEESGLICRLGAFVLEAACAQLRQWQDAALTPVRMAVNLSPRQICDPLWTETLGRHISDAGIEPSLLEFELTEHAFMDSDDDTARFMRTLATLGIGLVLDDFGTGFSSLGYLRRFPVGRIKLDRSFVCDIDTNTADAALVRATVAMADCLGIPVVAEGIETAGQLSLLRAHGCREGQGFLFARPLVGAEMTRLLADATSPYLTAALP